jgi:hypothetical protein
MDLKANKKCDEKGGENIGIEEISFNGASLQSRNCKLINNGENNALTDNREAWDQYQQQGQLIPRMSPNHPG